jgi:uncharacterized protein (TIGR00369 family)
MTKMSAAELNDFFKHHFQDGPAADYEVEKVDDMYAQVRLKYHDRHLRPGETISGASLMTLADMAMYMAVLAMIGPVALAVTTNLNINFLRKPGRADVIGKARILKLGRRLAVGDVTMYSDGDPEPVAHATVTYSIPPRI